MYDVVTPFFYLIFLHISNKKENPKKCAFLVNFNHFLFL